MPMSCKYRISVPFERQPQDWQGTKTSKSTMDAGQRSKTFPDRDGRGEIQNISKNWVTLWARRVRKSGFLPFPCKNEDRDAKRQQIERKRVNHGDKERAQAHHAGFIYTDRYRLLSVTGAWHVCARQPRNRWPFGYYIVIGADSYRYRLLTSVPADEGGSLLSMAGSPLHRHWMGDEPCAVKLSVWIRAALRFVVKRHTPTEYRVSLVGCRFVICREI